MRSRFRPFAALALSALVLVPAGAAAYEQELDKLSREMAQSIVAANAFIKAGMQVPARSLVAGVPGRIVRPVSDEEIAWIHWGLGLHMGTAVSQNAAGDLLGHVPPGTG